MKASQTLMLFRLVLSRPWFDLHCLHGSHSQATCVATVGCAVLLYAALTRSWQYVWYSGGGPKFFTRSEVDTTAKGNTNRFVFVALFRKATQNLTCDKTRFSSAVCLLNRKL